MENNLENKARFFALYWGQSLIMMPNIGMYQKIPIHHVNLNYIQDCILELTPLSDITDEDAIEVYDLVYVSDFKPKFKIGEIKETLLKNFHEEFTDFSPKDFLLIFDNLRSKGYALPWMGLSVEKLIEYGWVKLKTLNK